MAKLRRRDRTPDQNSDDRAIRFVVDPDPSKPSGMALRHPASLGADATAIIFL